MSGTCGGTVVGGAAPAGAGEGEFIVGCAGLGAPAGRAF